jgi:hypothetical protein
MPPIICAPILHINIRPPSTQPHPQPPAATLCSTTHRIDDTALWIMSTVSWADLPFTNEEQDMLWSTFRLPLYPHAGSPPRHETLLAFQCHRERESTYQDFASAPRNLPTFSANLSDLNGAKDAAPATAPTLSADTLTNMSNHPTYVYSVSMLQVVPSTLTYLAVPQDCLSSWHIPAPRGFRSCFCGDASCSPETELPLI